MRLKHVGLACSTEENADKFYQDLLGLNKSEPKTLPADLAKAIFNVDAVVPIINYLDENLHCEIFITNRVGHNTDPIGHLCLEVENLSGFIDKCRSMGVAIDLFPKGDKTLTFIRDFDGNLFEIKDG